MSRGLVVIAVVALLLMVVTGLSFAQDAKPWKKPGTTAGQEIVGPDGGKMVWVPAGKFDMGAEDLLNARPVHHVHISKGFWLGKCTVTLGQWKAYCQAAGVAAQQASASGDNYPVTNVNWDEAKAYCRYYGMALPTEAEWEYAARGPQNRKYPWGDTWDEDKCCNTGNKGPEGQTFPVGSFPEGASWCGALDMAGNVWQWCKDWYSAYADSPKTDPSGPDTGDNIPGLGQCRLVRGGSWIGDASLCRSAVRYGLDPTLRSHYLGFRCSRTP